MLYQTRREAIPTGSDVSSALFLTRPSGGATGFQRRFRLIHPIHGHSKSGGNGFTLATSPLQGWGLAADQERLLRGVVQMVLDGGQMVRDETGRASFRERGCLYV